MCIEVAVITSGERIYCETVGELAAALGLPHEAVSADPSDHCLCNAYLDKLRARRATDAEGWPFPDCVIEKSDNQAASMESK